MKDLQLDPWETRADHLAENDWVILDDFLPTEVLTISRNFLKKKLELDEFKQAGIGALNEFRIEKGIRSDEIFWLERERDSELHGFFTQVDEAIAHLNRLCFLSISGSEFHLAHYPEGSFYKRHLDQFDSRSNRLISMICYLNEYWKPEHGGELRLYAKDGTHQDVAPLPGRMILFKSDAVPHEVLSSKASRYSITGWLLHQPPGLGYLLG
ncbi:2OG-Fe(II) oxygenase [Cryomorphaceae bacterium 1068]|nr:2OG-Fe(II) oxygenase [Cryomorphaceae bacterium 1068]